MESTTRCVTSDSHIRIGINENFLNIERKINENMSIDYGETYGAL